MDARNTIEKRCSRCGRAKLDHTARDLQCYRGKGLGYWQTHYSPVADADQKVILQARILARIDRDKA